MALVKCPECGKDVSDKAKTCPHCGYAINSFSAQLKIAKQQTASRPRLDPSKMPVSEQFRRGVFSGPVAAVVIIAIIGLSVVIALLKSDSTERSSSPARSGDADDRRGLAAISRSSADHYSAVLAAYGTPERDDSTEYDDPRPPVVTRLIEYRPENVKIALVVNARLGDPPPYASWKIIGCIDINTDTRMSIEEAAKRLQRRMK